MTTFIEIKWEKTEKKKKKEKNVHDRFTCSITLSRELLSHTHER